MFWGGDSEEILVEFVIHASSEVASELEMLELIFAEGNVGSIVEEDIGGHEDWVIEKADGNVVFVFLGLFLQLDHARSFAKIGETIENPAKFTVGGNVGLAVDVDIGMIGIQTRCHVIFDAFDGFLEEGGVIDGGSERVKIGDEHIDSMIVVKVFFGKINHGRIGAKKIGDGWFFVGSDAGEDRLHENLLGGVYETRTHDLFHAMEAL